MVVIYFPLPSLLWPLKCYVNFFFGIFLVLVSLTTNSKSSSYSLFRYWQTALIAATSSFLPQCTALGFSALSHGKIHHPLCILISLICMWSLPMILAQCPNCKQKVRHEGDKVYPSYLSSFLLPPWSQTLPSCALDSLTHWWSRVRKALLNPI